MHRCGRHYDDTALMFEVDFGSTVSQTGLTHSGGDGNVRGYGEKFVEVIDCSFMHNKRTPCDVGGEPTV